MLLPDGHACVAVPFPSCLPKHVPVQLPPMGNQTCHAFPPCLLAIYMCFTSHTREALEVSRREDNFPPSS